jgi:DNA-binding NtrC family response regulator
VAVNCGAIPEALLESELFGHMKGAFTDAHANHKGLFQQADGGTLLLDEIGDMPPALQVKLLRVLQERAVRPLGASQSIEVDVRIISATHRDLDAAMAAGQFREDLYYRLNVVTLTLPPLSARREDIPLLANHFLQRLSTKYGKRLSGFAPEALKALTTAAWPGNVRQLFNVVEQVCALSSSPLMPAGAGAAGAARADGRGADLCRGQAAFRARLPGRPAQTDRRQRGRRGPAGRPQSHGVLPADAEARAHARSLQGRPCRQRQRPCRRIATHLSR